MITVNGDSLDHAEGMTVQDVLKARNYIFPLLVVKVNGEFVPREAYGRTLVPDNAIVQVLHLMSGG